MIYLPFPKSDGLLDKIVALTLEEVPDDVGRPSELETLLCWIRVFADLPPFGGKLFRQHWSTTRTFPEYEHQISGKWDLHPIKHIFSSHRDLITSFYGSISMEF